ncbi:MAG: hypothetical protein J3Q66DRAFT_33549 [Benniella sp.]|nr:MAG: hypothetical protein J3Q66DRAFT_33549 [Benniella sp.]
MQKVCLCLNSPSLRLRHPLSLLLCAEPPWCSQPTMALMQRCESYKGDSRKRTSSLFPPPLLDKKTPPLSSACTQHTQHNNTAHTSHPPIILSSYTLFRHQTNVLTILAWTPSLHTNPCTHSFTHCLSFVVQCVLRLVVSSTPLSSYPPHGASPPPLFFLLLSVSLFLFKALFLLVPFLFTLLSVLPCSRIPAHQAGIGIGKFTLQQI